LGLAVATDRPDHKRMVGSDWNALPLIGRDTELATLGRGLTAAMHGACSFQLIAGSHGLGKTRLLNATAEQAARHGFTVVRAVAYQSDANVPYSVVADGLSPLVRTMDASAIRTIARGAEAELSQIVPAFGGTDGRAVAVADGNDLTTRLRWHTAQFLARLSSRAPLLFTIDNAHWADPSSVALLHFVLRHTPDARVMFAAAFNTLEAEAACPIRALAKSAASIPAFQQMQLEPLTQEDIAALLVQRFAVEGKDVADFAVFLHSRTLGNPFFVEESIKTLIERGSLRSVNGRWVGWDVEDVDVPSTIREVLLERVGALSAPARAIADMAAVVASLVSHDLLREMTGMDPAAFLAGVEELRRAAIFSEAEEAGEVVYDFSHPLLQRTLYEEVGAARRREFHASIARSMQEHFGADADRHATELAYHYVRAGTPALAAASMRYFRLAGKRALVMRANREAARYLQHGLDLVDRNQLVDRSVALLPELVEDLARARQRLGEYDASRILWTRATEMHAASGDLGALARAERRRGLLWYWSGNMHQAIADYDLAREHARAAGNGETEVHALAGKGIALMSLGMPDEAKQEVHAALAIAERLGDAGLRGRVQRALLILYGYAGPADVANGFAKRVLEYAEAAGDLSLAWGAHHATAVLACFTAKASVVAHHVAEADRIAKALHSPLLVAQGAEVAIEYASAKGDWAEGLALAEQVIPVARAMSPRALLPRLLVWTGTILLNRDEIERAKACFDEAWEITRAGSAASVSADLNAVIVAHIGQAAYCMTMRDWIAAIEFAQRGVAIASRHGMTSWTLHRLLPMISEAAVWVGDFTLAESTAARLRADAIRFEHALDMAWAFTVEQLVRRWRDNEPGVVERLLSAADAFEAVPLVFHAGRLRRHIAKLLTIDGDRDGAARELRRAHDTFLRLGAALELRLTREAMRELGVRPPVQTIAPGGVLTHRELEVARLVALHKTNKEIARALDISSRTVSTHLSNVFLKLGVDSRSALAEVIRTNTDLQ
jgi:DNA-binding CsgD family transcriptional regulator/tetratricopeptide (TPR) repeat protein